MKRSALLLLAGTVALPGCMIPSNVVAADQRAVKVEEKALPFATPKPSDLDGLFVATAIRGPAAASLRHLCYWFGSGGAFSGAALVGLPNGPEFQTLSGRWALVGDRLSLGDNEPAKLEAAPGYLRITGDDGTTVVLQRSAER